MPLSGGAAAKAGDRYELRWTVRQFIRLLTADAASIELEPIGEDGDLIEFRLLRTDGEVEVHQVKRQQSARGAWSNADLAQIGVLPGFRKHAIEDSARYRFISTQAAKSLPELQERAAVAASSSQLERLLSSSEKLQQEYADLQRRLNAQPAPQLWEALRRSAWDALSERQLGDDVLALLDAYLTGNPRAALGILAVYALDSIHQRITAQTVLAHLKAHEIVPSDIALDTSVVARLAQSCDDYLASQAFKIGDLVVERHQAAQVVARLTASESPAKHIFLAGPAGIGKTGTVGQIVDGIMRLDWPVLAFRVDRLDETQQTAMLGEQLVGRKKSPVAVLAGVAQGADCLLVIDQLDAVSVVSGRRPAFFDAIDVLVREATAHPNMRVLLACRRFDLDNDQRLRALRQEQPGRTETVEIGPFTREQTVAVLQDLGVDPNPLGDEQIQLLQTPLHLALLAGVLREENNYSFDFTRVKDLYDAFWRSKRTALLPLLGDRNAFERGVYALCDAMNEQQRLAVRRGDLPIGDSDLDMLVSNNVVLRSGHSLSFFHEGFFDYVFARRFCEGGQPLLGLLLSAEQGLFRRYQVRQILVYRRDDEFALYLDDLQQCLAADAVRFHIKKLIIDVVGQVIHPTDDEWEILSAHSPTTAKSPADPVRSAIWPSAPWFRHLLDRGVLRQWIDSEPTPLRNFAFRWIERMVEYESERIVSFLEDLIAETDAHNEELLWVLTWRESASRSERLEALFHRLAAEKRGDWGALCKRYKEFIKLHAYGSGTDVAVACRALGHWLDLLLDSGDQEFLQRMEDIQQAVDDYVLEKLEQHAPELAFVNAVAQPVLRMMSRAANQAGAAPYSDEIWLGGFHGWLLEPEVLLRTLVTALRKLSRSAPEDFLRVVADYRHSDVQAAHAVLMRALMLDHDAFDALAFDYLAETWHRWGIWQDQGQLWDCCELLRSIASSLTGAQLARLEPMILVHFEQWDREPVDRTDAAAWRYRLQQARRFREDLGKRQYLLLNALSEARLSLFARRRLVELTRKAQALQWQGEKPKESPRLLSAVVSPLSSRAAEAMTDRQWLAAIQRYQDDDKWTWAGHTPIGGALELSRAMEDRVKAEPERFARLLLRFPDQTNHWYFEATIRGLKGGGLPLDLLQAIVERGHARPNRPHGRVLPDLIVSHADTALSDDLLDVLAWYATEDPEPEQERWQEHAQSARGSDEGNPHQQGINTARGRAAHAIADLIFKDERYWRHFRPVLARMVQDVSVAVRTCVARACLAALRHDREAAIGLFLQLCDSEDILLATPWTEQFLWYTASDDLPRLRPIIERMLRSEVAGVRQAGARQLALVALSLAEARELVSLAISADAATRKGLAQVFMANLTRTQDRSYCAGQLISLFQDRDAEVRRETLMWSRYVEETAEVLPVRSVALSFVESPAFAEGSERFFWMLEKVADAPPELLFRAVERFVELKRAEVADPATSAHGTADNLSQLLARAYRQAEDDARLRGRCLDLFDALLAAGGYGADDAIEGLSR